MSVCFICKKPQGDIKVRTVNAKGVKTLLDRAKAKNDVDSEQFLKNISEVIVHISCYYNYSENQTDNVVRRMSNSSSSSSVSDILGTNFDFVHYCFICGEAFQDESGLPPSQQRKVCQVRNDETKKSFLDLICNRTDDEAKRITERIANVPSLVDVEGKYHKDCSKRLYSKKWSEQKKNDQRKKNIDKAMEDVFAFLDENSDRRKFSISDLMKSIKADYIPQKRTIKKRLKEKYKDDILFFNKIGQDTIVCFKDFVYRAMSTRSPTENNDHEIKSKKSSNKKNDNQDERLQKVRDAAAIILEDIRSQNETNDVPTVIPETLSVLLSEIMCQSKRKSLLAQGKCISMARSIVAATRRTDTELDADPQPGPSKKKKKQAKKTKVESTSSNM
ncbi:unnamed protein product [Colias eurytheme]|nr:unnamed protein product [Colias eurytheme]